MATLLEYGGVVGILVLLVAAAMAAVLVQGLVQSLVGRRQGSRGGGAGPGGSAQPELFGQDAFEAVALVEEGTGFSLQKLAELLGQMDVDAALNRNGYYSVNQDGQLMFYVVNGYGDGRLDELSGHTRRLLFVLPLATVQSPTRGFDLMIQAAATLFRALGGALVDAQNQALSAQGIKHLQERVRAWEMRERRRPTTQ